MKLFDGFETIKDLPVGDLRGVSVVEMTFEHVTDELLSLLIDQPIADLRRRLALGWPHCAWVDGLACDLECDLPSDGGRGCVAHRQPIAELTC